MLKVDIKDKFVKDETLQETNEKLAEIKEALGGGGGGDPVPCSFTVKALDMDDGDRVVKTLTGKGYIGQSVTFAFATSPTVIVDSTEYTLMNIHGEQYADFVDILLTEDGQVIEIDSYAYQ